MYIVNSFYWKIIFDASSIVVYLCGYDMAHTKCI